MYIGMVVLFYTKTLEDLGYVQMATWSNDSSCRDVSLDSTGAYPVQQDYQG